MAGVVFDPERSQVRVRTRALGPLARLAHDLEIDARFLGHLDVDGDLWSLSLEFSPASFSVVGVRKNGHVLAHVLTPSDRREIERRMVREVFRDQPVSVEAEPGGEGVARLSVRIGRAAQVCVVPFEQGEQGVLGDVRLSLSRLGVPPIRGPMGAFRVDDQIEVHFVLVPVCPEDAAAP